MINGNLSLRAIIGRGLRQRCPRCGKGHLFRKWVRLRDQCEVCGLRYLRDQGDLWGYLLIVDRALFIFPLIVILYFRLWNPHSVWYWIFIVSLVFGLIITIPHRNGVAVALEYYTRTRWGDSDSGE